jgi:hypothetical protein
MGFTKGNKWSTGRPKNSRNKNTSIVRANFKKLVEDNLTSLQNDLDQLHPEARIKAIVSLAKFVLPQLTTITLQEDSPEHKTLHLSQADFKIIEDLK